MYVMGDSPSVLIAAILSAFIRGPILGLSIAVSHIIYSTAVIESLDVGGRWNSARISVSGSALLARIIHG